MASKDRDGGAGVDPRCVLERLKGHARSGSGVGDGPGGVDAGAFLAGLGVEAEAFDLESDVDDGGGDLGNGWGGGSVDGPGGSRSSGPAGPGAKLAALLSSVAGVVDEEPEIIGPDQRRQVAVVLAEAKGRLDALFARSLGVLDTFEDHQSSGARSVASWIESRSEISRRDAGAQHRIHRELRRYAHLEEAWLWGRLGTAKIRLLLEAADGVEDQLERDQGFLTDTLAPLTPFQARIAIGRWREAALAENGPSEDGPEPEPAGNSLGHGKPVGQEHIYGLILGRRDSHEFERTLKAEIDKRFRTGDYNADDGLSDEARRADALLRLMRRGLETKTEFGKPRPSTVNILDLAAILGLSPQTIADICARPRETEDGRVLSVFELLDDLTQGSLTTVLGFYGIEGRFCPIGTITTNRLPDAAQRRLLQIRDGNCMHPGCDQRAHRCVPHHEPPFQETGRTTVTELVLLCHRHHELRHKGVNHYHLSPDGDLTITTPTGDILPTTRPGRKLPLNGPNGPNGTNGARSPNRRAGPGPKDARSTKRTTGPAINGPNGANGANGRPPDRSPPGRSTPDRPPPETPMDRPAPNGARPPGGPSRSEIHDDTAPAGS